MVPLAEYATVSEEATLFDAVLALEKAQEAFDPKKHRHRAILVFDKKNKIVGKLGQLDILRALEPRYAEMGDLGTLSRTGFSPQFLRSMVEKFALWDESLRDICSKAARLKVKDIMYTPTEGEYVEESASLGDAIHQLLMGHHQSLLVTRGKEIVGILRLVDVFKEICDTMKSCAL
ncbi:MAG: CBS domain-containing protein [Deltaproteobacteria bacterium]|nr:MAG: CBS domain-containing protein [Deltaproteobacteria bacterium]